MFSIDSSAHWWWLAGIVALVILAAVGDRRRGIRGYPMVGVVLVAVSTGAVVTMVHVAIQHAGPLAGWAQAGATATVVGKVASYPTTVRAAPRWALRPPDEVQRTQVRLTGALVSARGTTIRTGAVLLVDLPSGRPIPALGSWVLVRGRLAASRSAGIGARLQVSKGGSAAIVDRPGLVDRAAVAMRSGLQAVLVHLPPGSAGVIAGLALGDESQMPAWLADDMRASGLSHLLAVSGGNVAIVLAMALGAARLVGLRIRGRVAVGLLAIAGFVVLVGPEASVLRAATMGGIVIVGMLVGGRRRGVSVLASATVLLLVLIPEFAVSWAFALSVAATLGILVLVEPIAGWVRAHRGMRRAPRALIDALAVTMAAQIATLPILLAMGVPVSLAAVPANLLAMPAVPAVTVLGLVGAVLAPIWSPATQVVCWIAQWPAAWIARVARMCAHPALPAVPTVPAGPLGTGLLILTVALATLVIVRHGGPDWRGRHVATVAMRIGALMLVLVMVLPWLWPRTWPGGRWLLIACDVGQGDALLVRARSGQVMLVDTGPPDGEVATCLREAGVDAIDLLVITHFHLDHVAGTAPVLAEWPVRRALVSPIDEPALEAAVVRSQLARAGVPVGVAAPGMTVPVGSMRALVLWPARRINEGSVPNNASIVLSIRDGPFRLLLTGDIETRAQEAVMLADPVGDYDVVKIPHHGSRVGAEGFARWANARAAIVSVGAANPYGHPDPDTVMAWRRTGARICRTDVDGGCAIVWSVPTADGTPELALTRRATSP